MNVQTLKKPLITERSIEQTKKGFYTFAVARNARKETLKKVIEEQFNVNVLSIRTIKMPGKTRRSGKSMRASHTSAWKKAIVKIKSDQKIPIFETVT